jgi:hypothetical protein
MKPHSVIAVLTVLVMLPLSAFALPVAPDECAFIREKIASLPETGGEVIIPSGVYTCNSPVVIDRSQVTLSGGDHDVELRLGNNVSSPVIVMGDIHTPPRPLHDIQVKNLKIDGNRWFQKNECWGGPCDSGGTSYIRNNGITVRAITRGRIENVRITSARSGGIVTERGCFDLQVNQVTCTDSEFDGFAGYETFGSRFTDLTLSDNRAAGISLDIRFHGNLFRDVRIERNGDVGIFMRDASYNVFERLSISGSGSHGVFVAMDGDVSTCSSHNEFQDLAVTRSRGYGFRLNDRCGGNRLTGASAFRQNRDGCVSEAPEAKVEREGRVQCEN